MYEPREDSELLEGVVVQYARGTVCDIGTGSGVLARAAHQKGCTVTAIDTDPAVIEALHSEPFKVVHADSILRLRTKFDTVVCNPPYLPDDEEVHDIALHGGPHGYEYTVRVISEVAHRLASDGQFLLLISTLTKPAVVEEALRVNGFVFSIVAREKLFMEELLVYRAILAIGEPAAVLGEGWRSRVYVPTKGKGTVAVKVTTLMRARKEAQLLRAANRCGVGPKLLGVHEGFLRMRRVDGEPFDKYMLRTKDRKVARAALRQAFALDRAGIKKHELNRPAANVIVTARRRVVFIDFERSIFSPRPGNVTQLASWLSHVFNRDVRILAQKYARARRKDTFETLVRALTARA